MISWPALAAHALLRGDTSVRRPPKIVGDDAQVLSLGADALGLWTRDPHSGSAAIHLPAAPPNQNAAVSLVSQHGVDRARDPASGAARTRSRRRNAATVQFLSDRL